MSGKLRSPCIDVCKFRRAGHCIGCSMTKPQKKLWKGLRKPGDQRAFLELLVNQQAAMGKYLHWTQAYLRKCAKKKVAPKVPGLDAG